jgi:predicted house-cleaning noncanonical NTP pyrophosphatase (MazG superfamily)
VEKSAGLIHGDAARTLYRANRDEFRTEYGAKACGLCALPPEWTPTFALIPAAAFVIWQRNGRDSLTRFLRTTDADVLKASNILSGDGIRKVILRSSAVEETLEDRGKYASIVANDPTNFDALVDAAINIFSKFAEKTPLSTVALVMHAYMEATVTGHLSNEVRFSPTRDRWSHEIHLGGQGQFVQDHLSSLTAKPPNTKRPLACTTLRQIHGLLRQLGSWVNGFSNRRAHIEWCVAGDVLWIVQLDFEEEDHLGVDPRIAPRANPQVDMALIRKGGRYFKRYAVGTSTRWSKLKNVCDFDVGNRKPKHILFYATGNAISGGVATAAHLRDLAQEIQNLTNGRAVIRTDSVSPILPGYNLPRTETLDGPRAANWLGAQIDAFRRKKIDLQQVCFILHEFIPAGAAAWSYFDSKEKIVAVDALWGLPDALQFCPHDSYQVDLRTWRVASQRIRYKPHLLQEQNDGRWEYVRVNRKFSRFSTLSSKALLHIARQTELISKKVGGDAQIMWFCDIPVGQDVGDHLPWYRAKEYADNVQTQNRQFRTVEIRNSDDLAALSTGNVGNGRTAIRLSPEAPLIRDNNFLEAVIEKAKMFGLPVELAGSTLGHAFYRLQQEGLVIFCADPYFKYERVRQRKVFDKLVRDEIPSQIASKGERVVQARLNAVDAPVALLGKLIEEALEFANAKNGRERQEELADLYEVLRGIATVSGLNLEQVATAAEAKRAKRGGFEGLLVLRETSLPKGSSGPQNGASYVRSSELSLADIGVTVVKGNEARIPMSKLVASAQLGPIDIPIPEIGVTLKLDLSGGFLRMSISQIPGPKSDDAQLKFGF